MMDSTEREIKKCIDSGKCDIVFYELNGCGHCTNMERKLDELGVDYHKERADKELVDKTGINSAPQVHFRLSDDEVAVVQKASELDKIFRKK